MRNKTCKARVNYKTRPEFAEIEDELDKEILKMREDGVNINGDLIMAHALIIAKNKNILNFRASRGWLWRMLESKSFYDLIVYMNSIKNIIITFK